MTTPDVERAINYLLDLAERQDRRVEELQRRIVELEGRLADRPRTPVDEAWEVFNSQCG
jgi:RNase P subunit RPR2